MNVYQISDMRGEDKYGQNNILETRNHICEWIPTDPNDSEVGECRLREKLLESNYCCRSIAGAESCPYRSY